MAVVTDDARTAHLVYWRGEPRVLLLNTVAEIGAGGATAGVGVPRPWKKPVNPPRPRATPYKVKPGADRTVSPFTA